MVEPNKKTETKTLIGNVANDNLVNTKELISENLVQKSLTGNINKPKVAQTHGVSNRKNLPSDKEA